MLVYFLIVFGFFHADVLATNEKIPLAPRLHYGHCKSYEGEQAACVEPEMCNFYATKMKRNPNFIRSKKCNIESAQMLICCPKYLSNIKRLSDSKNSKLPEPPNCGLMLSNKIYGGAVTDIDEHPWVARIAYATPRGVQHNCGGTLLNARWVLTAAHCVTALRSDTRVVGVRLGEWDTEQNPDCIIVDFYSGRKECAPEHIDVDVDIILPHPKFNLRQKNFPHDIALLRMERSVGFSPFVRPICLTLETFAANRDFAGLPGVVVGWGRTEYNNTSSPLKLRARVDIWNSRDCKEIFQTIGIPMDETHQFCAGGVKGIDTCRGDSGGPLTLSWQSYKPFYAVGIVSYGKVKCGTQGFPGVYTRVAPYVKWIKQTIAENQ